MAFALLAPRPNSHPFHERQFSLKEPVKIGRAVAKAKSSNTNGIFDCKVLSRNHAVIWYENGKFMLQDTKSSNGTYVNSVRLSRGSEESEPCEIKSGDTLQFGVEVVENSKNVTHGCIIGLVTLFNEDGTEAANDQEDAAQGLISLLTSPDQTVQPHELWQLAQLLQEALHRDEMMENKLATLQRMLGNAHVASEDTFQGFIQEDKLLSRLETLENQLELLTNDMSEEEVQASIVTYQNERLQYESAAKERLQVILKEKIDILQKCGDLERLLNNSEDEYSYMKSMCEKSQYSIQELIEKNKQGSEEICRIKEELAECNQKYVLLESEYVKKINDLKCLLEEAERRGSAAAVEVESLQAECDFTKKQLQSMKERFEQLQEKCMVESGADNEFDMTGNDLPFASENATLEKDVKNKSAYIQALKEQLASTMLELKTLKDNQSAIGDKEVVAEMQGDQVMQELPNDFILIDDLHEKLMRVKELVNSLGKSAVKDEQTTLNSVEWKESILVDFNKCRNKSAIDRASFYKKALSTSIDLVNIISGDLQNLSVMSSLKDTNLNQGDTSELKDQVDLLQSQLAEECKINRKNMTIATSLEGQLSELNGLLNEEIGDKYMSTECLDTAIKLVKEFDGHTKLKEKVGACNLSEENDCLRRRLNSLQRDYDSLKQEHGLRSVHLDNLDEPFEHLDSLSTELSESDAYQYTEIANLSLDELQSHLELANKSIEELRYQKKVIKEKGTQKQSQLVNLILTFFLLMVTFGTLVMLDIIHVTPGTLPLLDESTWTEIWEQLF